MDNQTEWVETVEEGWNQLTGADTERILEAARSWKLPSVHSGSVGDGTASDEITNLLVRLLD